jgi:hypothetical protein
MQKKMFYLFVEENMFELKLGLVRSPPFISLGYNLYFKQLFLNI